jgi:hypothetical protein
MHVRVVRRSSYVAEAVVYLRSAGTVARSRGFGEPVIVLVTIRGMTCVDLGGLAIPRRSSP